MLALRSLFKNQVRNVAVIAGPPSNPLSTGDKALHGFLIIFSFLSVPMFVTYKLPAWKKQRG